MEIYYAAPSIYGRKVLAVLEEKGLDYTIHKMSFENKDHKSPEYLKLNPNGEIPTLVDDNVVVYESTAIIEYLNDEYPEPPLMPESSDVRAMVRMIEDYCDLHLYPAIIGCRRKMKKEALTDEDKNELKETVLRIEQYLGNKNYIAGEFSLADCAVMSAFASLEAAGLAGEILHSPTLTDYFSRLKARPGYKGASLMTL
jgi:glutathione S-transferase